MILEKQTRNTEFSENWQSKMFENIISLLILLVVDFLLDAISERLPAALAAVRFPNWRGNFKSSTPIECSKSPKGDPHTAKRKQRKERQRGRKGQVTLQDLTQIILSVLQEDTPQEDGTSNTDRSTGGSRQSPTDVNHNSSSSSEIGPCNTNEMHEKHQVDFLQGKLPAESGSGQVFAATEILTQGESGPSNIHCQPEESHSRIERAENDGGAASEVAKILFSGSAPSTIRHQPDESQSQTECIANDDEVAGESTAKESVPHVSSIPEDNIKSADKKKTKQFKQNGWMKKKKDMKSPWTEWRKVTEGKTLVQKTKRKVFRYPAHQVSSTGAGKSPEDRATNSESAAATLQDNNDERLNTLQEELINKNRSTSEESSEAVSSDNKTPGESDGENAKESNHKTAKSIKELPPDVLQISVVESIYESRATITGKPTMAGKERRPFKIRASLRTPTAPSFKRKRSPDEWQVAVVHKKTVGHKRKTSQI